jgi:hypothetical protein
VADQQIAVKAAVKALMMEIGRGGRIMVVDEHLRGSERELCPVGVTVDEPVTRTGTEKVKLKGSIFVARRARTFASMSKKCYYGPVWVASKDDHRISARKSKQFS